MTKKTINPKDSELFRQAIGDVRAVKSDKVELQQEKVRPYPKPKPQDLNEAWLSMAELDIDEVSHEESLSFAVSGVQHAVLTKLRKGFFGVQAELDLHGLHIEGAKQQLLQFLNNSVMSGYRCVHIIHGKGYRSSVSHPILKNQINRWLRQHKDVLAFCSAPPKQGGAGAVYVLLRIAKEYHEKFE
jgi:DNA-nicking Smr family endonuclease